MFRRSWSFQHKAHDRRSSIGDQNGYLIDSYRSHARGISGRGIFIFDLRYLSGNDFLIPINNSELKKSMMEGAC